MSNLKIILDDIINQDGEVGLYFKVLYIKPNLFKNKQNFISSDDLKISLTYWPYICSYDRNEIYIGNGVDRLENKDLSSCIFFNTEKDKNIAKKRILNAFSELIATLS